MIPNQDLERLKLEYQNRELNPENRSKYSPSNIAYLYANQQRQRATIDLLNQLGMREIDKKRIIEVGSGRGDILQEWAYHRTNSNQLFGLELLFDRLQDAGQRFPGINFVNADAQYLPFASNEFDIVLQYTVLSSILDDSIKQNIAKEMLRILKPNGLLLWYDFWLNPTNPQTKGIPKIEIKKLFPNCKFVFKRITLAPPLARRLISFSWMLGVLLEKLTLLNTHYLVAIKPV